MEHVPASFASQNLDLTGTLKLGPAVKTIGENAFNSNPNLTGLDLSQATSLVSIGDYAFYNSDITGTIVIPANVKSIGTLAFYLNWKLTVDLSQAASLESIGSSAFLGTAITGTIVTPFNVPTYNAANSFPSGVTIVKG